MNIPDLFRNSEALIKDILKDNPDTRGDDIELIIKVWERQGLVLTDGQKYLLRKVYSPETIRRTRQKIQEFGLYRPEDGKLNQRSFLDDEYRKNFGVNEEEVHP